eukprot:CAMPEP_0182880702 /NCGR_PEP_ID=MMETSP0034_2-20130328/16722_1 /TAXON_ID=156128 /ORGANISM="Nephroselmis pyriformis, Strain CCMP717" /LENGTH=395 /DNA_ID=CAMNT_0025013699 /DNA_START=149 /DNA_END=1332 /DNA_ORIENTATION=+
MLLKKSQRRGAGLGMPSELNKAELQRELEAQGGLHKRSSTWGPTAWQDDPEYQRQRDGVKKVLAEAYMAKNQKMESDVQMLNRAKAEELHRQVEETQRQRWQQQAAEARHSIQGANMSKQLEQMRYNHLQGAIMRDTRADAELIVCAEDAYYRAAGGSQDLGPSVIFPKSLDPVMKHISVKHLGGLSGGLESPREAPQTCKQPEVAGTGLVPYRSTKGGSQAARISSSAVGSLISGGGPLMGFGDAEDPAALEAVRAAQIGLLPPSRGREALGLLPPRDHGEMESAGQRMGERLADHDAYMRERGIFRTLGTAEEEAARVQGLLAGEDASRRGSRTGSRAGSRAGSPRTSGPPLLEDVRDPAGHEDGDAGNRSTSPTLNQGDGDATGRPASTPSA